MGKGEIFHDWKPRKKEEYNSLFSHKIWKYTNRKSFLRSIKDPRNGTSCRIMDNLLGAVLSNPAELHL